jgi:hypothetical protein
MKKRIRQFSLVLPLLILVPVVLKAQDDDEKNREKERIEKRYDHVKKKEVNKTFNVTSKVKLDIENSFGAVEVQTWTRNEIKVDVSIQVSSNSESLAQKVLDGISIENASENGKSVSFKTKIAKDKSGKHEKSSMQINYIISMPAVNPLEIMNSFGPITIPDYKGEVELTSKFGELTTGNLTAIKKILVEFGKANLGSVAGGDITIKFSKATVSNLSGASRVNIEFCDNVRLNLHNDLNSLTLKASYSTVNLRPQADIPAAYAISTSFGSFKNKTSVKFAIEEEDNRGPKFDKEYSGKSGNGSVPVKIKSSFSTLILGEATDAEMKDKEKDKNKEKRKSTVTI